MSNFKQDILTEAGDEPIETIIIGQFSWGSDVEREHLKRFTPLDPAEALEFLNYEYDAGYGGVECHAIYAYTATRVIFVSQYDGSTCLYSIPRAPIPGDVIMPGG